MQNYFIIEMLGIKNKHVDVWDMHSESDVFLVELYTKVKKQKCPFCKKKTKHVHSYHTQDNSRANLVQ